MGVNSEHQRPTLRPKVQSEREAVEWVLATLGLAKRPGIKDRAQSAL